MVCTLINNAKNEINVNKFAILLILLFNMMTGLIIFQVQNNSSINTPTETLNQNFNNELPGLPQTIPSFNGFIENQGQISNSDVTYYYSTNIGNIGFTSTKIVVSKVLDSKTFSFELSFIGSNNIKPVGKNQLDFKLNYFKGHLSLTDISSWAEIWYYGIYPNIDLRYYYSSAGLKYDFIVHPGGMVEDINIRPSDNIQLSVLSESVTYHTRNQDSSILLKDTDLFVYQEDNKEISAQFITKDTTTSSYGFHIEIYDENQILIIDPYILTHSSVYGGSNEDQAYDIIMDSSENLIVVGKTFSSDFPNTSDFGSLGDWDIFVMKVNKTANKVVFSTIIGGSGDDEAYAVALDSNDDIFITGQTDSNFLNYSDYLDYSSGTEAFLLKLISDGTSIDYLTYIGGSGFDAARGIAIDQSNQVIIVGHTSSTSAKDVNDPGYQDSDFPLQEGSTSSHGGGTYDGFVSIFDNNSLNLIYSGYWGGNRDDYVNDVVVDNLDNIYFVGSTHSNNGFNITNAEEPTYGSGLSDAFISGMDYNGNVDFSTYWNTGSNSNENATALAYDSNLHSLYITGTTDTFGSIGDVFVLYFDIFDALTYAVEYIGANDNSIGEDIVVDSNGQVYVTGYTKDTTFDQYPLNPVFPGGEYSGFITVYESGLNSLVYSSLIGGDNNDYPQGIFANGSNNVYLTGYTSSSNYPLLLPESTPTSTSDKLFVSLFQLETFLPTIELLNVINNTVYQSGTQIDFNVTDIHSGISSYELEWLLDSTTINQSFNMLFENIFSFSLLNGDGLHTIRFAVADNNGNVAEKYFSFYTDDTSPNIQWIGPVNNSVQQSGVAFLMEIIDNSSLQTLLFNWDDNGNNTFSNVSQLFSPINDTIHILEIFAEDEVGNWAKSVLFVITDDTLPVINLISPDNNSIFQSDTHINISATDLHGLNLTLFNWDNGVNITGSITDNIKTPIIDQQHILTVYIQDIAGNWASAVFLYITDDTAPNITFISPLNTTLDISNISITFNVEDNILLDYVLYNWDGFQNQTITDPYQLTLVMNNTGHDLNIFAVDQAGNWANLTIGFTILSGDPEISETPDETSTTTGEDITSISMASNVSIPPFEFIQEGDVLTDLFIFVGILGGVATAGLLVITRFRRKS